MSDQDFRFTSNRNDRKDFQPLVINSNSHPSYTPVKLSVKTANDLKLMKFKPPEKPMVPYMRYSRKVWDSVKVANPEAKLWEIGKIVGQMWRDLNEFEKQEYIADYENAKADYCEQIKNYHNSQQYQSFLSNAIKKKTSKSDDNKIGNGVNSNILGSSNLVNTMNNNRVSINNENNYYAIAIEPAEDDGIDDSLSMRHVASNRFIRNHRLLNEIFNEYTVVDNRSIVTSQRMEQLKKQVTSLELHQEKLKQELQLIEEKNELKKKKIRDSSSEYEIELEKLNQFSINEPQIKVFFEKHYELIEKQWKDHVDRVLSQSGTNILDSEVGIENLRNNLESLISNSKTITSPPMTSSITLVALNQVSEAASLTSAAQTNSSHQNSANSTNGIQIGANQSSVSHSNPILAGTSASSSAVVINQSHPYQQQPPSHASIFNQQQMQAHQQVIHNMPIQSSVQQIVPHQNSQQHHLQQQQNQIQGSHIQQQTIASNVTTSMQQQQHPLVMNQATPLVQNHSSSLPGIHHQIVANQTQQQLHQQQPPLQLSSHMITPQNMMVSAPGQPTAPSTHGNEYSFQNQIVHQGYQTVYAQAPQTLNTIQQPIDQQNNSVYANQLNYPSPQQQQQYTIQQQQQQYQMQRSGSTGSFPQTSSVTGQRLVNPTQIQSPNQMIMMNNRSATAVGTTSQMSQGQQQNNVSTSNPNQTYQNFIIGQNQFNQQTQQFRSSNTPPTNNTSNIVSPSQHMQQTVSSVSSTTSIINSIPIQQQSATNSNVTQSPIVNRIQPSQQPQSTSSQIMQTNQSQIQVRHPSQLPPGTQQQQQMNFYNPQIPPQSQASHIYGMIHPQQQQQQHFRDPNMINQQSSQMNPYVTTQNTGTPPLSTASPQQSQQSTSQQPQQYNMIQPNLSQPVGVMMQQPSSQPNMMYAQHPQNLSMYTMPPQQQVNNMNQQVIMMQQQQVTSQPQIINNQYTMYQSSTQQPQPSSTGAQQAQQMSNPNLNQQPQSQQQQSTQPTTPQQSEQKSKGKKKQKTSKTSNASETT